MYKCHICQGWYEEGHYCPGIGDSSKVWITEKGKDSIFNPIKNTLIMAKALEAKGRVVEGKE